MDDHLLAIKMAQTTWIPILLLIISLIVHSVKSNSRVVVRPTDSDPFTCGDHVPCDTLSNLISNNQTIFSDESIEFLSGMHKINTTCTKLTIYGKKRNLRWFGNETRDTVINCQSPVAFVFQNVQSLTMKYLQFSACGHESVTLSYMYTIGSTSGQKVSSTLTLINTISFLMQQVVISQSRGYGLVGLTLQRGIITSCHFFDNNLSCSTGNCVGGGVAFFYERTWSAKKESLRIYLSITNSTFHNGADLSSSEAPYSCSSFVKSAYRPVFKANGLLVIAKHQRYRIIAVQITDSRFTQNTRNPIYPAVWIHDTSEEENHNCFSFVNCRFEREGTVRFSKWAIMQKPCRDLNQPTDGKCPHPLVELNNCSFTNRSQTALEICVKYLKYKYNCQAQKVQHVSINKCIFQHHNEEENNSYISVVRVISRTSLSNIAITIAQNYFFSNNITAAILLLHQIAGKFIMNLSKNYFLNNFNSKVQLYKLKDQLFGKMAENTLT